jgi:hypothetical protein
VAEVAGQRIRVCPSLRAVRLTRCRMSACTRPWPLSVRNVVVFCTKVHHRLLRPLLGPDQPPAPAELRNALTTIGRHVHDYTDHARLEKEA